MRKLSLNGTLCTLALLATGCVAQEQGTTTTLPASAEGAASSALTPTVSQVRIVRLSEVRGKVEMERGASQGLQPTFTNLPVVQGARLQSKIGVAEVEFEDNSTLRIAPLTEIEFTKLGRDSAGSTTNRVHLVSGTLYVSLLNTKGSEFEVQAGNRVVHLAPSTHVRLDVYPSGAQMTVFHGRASVVGGATEIAVGSGKVVKLGSGAEEQPTSARNEDPGLYDSWDKQQKQNHELRAANTFAGSPYTYGTADLNYYGSFVNGGGCGQIWQPYFAGAAFDPYASGIWAYYPGAGYSWVSPYPWGWTPYHSGNWIDCPGTGWGWQPGQAWSGLSNIATSSTIKNPIHRPVPPRPPMPGQSGLVGVGLASLHSSRVIAGDRMEFTTGSAGLGVPRDLGSNLQKASQKVASKGVAQSYISHEDPLQPAMDSLARGSVTGRAGETRLAATERPVSRPIAIRENDRVGVPMNAGRTGGSLNSGSISGAGRQSEPSIMSNRAPASTAGPVSPPSGGSKH